MDAPKTRAALKKLRNEQEQKTQSEQIDKCEQMKQEVLSHLECSVCSETLNEPVTLVCNHTFCYLCLLSIRKDDWTYLKQCPICRKRFCLPPEGVTNPTIKSIIQHLITEKKYNEVKEERARSVYKKTNEESIREEIKREYWDSMLENSFIGDSTGLQDDISFQPQKIDLVIRDKSVYMSSLAIVALVASSTTLFLLKFKR